MNRQTQISGFSLIEVTVAIGIVSFALLGVVGLIPVGLNTVKMSHGQAGAVNVLNSLAESLRNATTLDGINYTTNFAGKDVAFALGSAGTNVVTWNNLSIDGIDDSSPLGKRISIHLELVSPQVNATGSPTDTVKAIVSVAWSAQSELRRTNDEWSNAEGSITTALQFLPRR